jgi:hypothetical protein
MKAKEIKITEKTTKQGFVNILKDYLKSNVVDKNLSERIKYALDMFTKDMTKVSKTDLHDLAVEAVEAIKALTPATATPAPVEASLKPKKTGAKKPAKVEEPVEEAEEEAEEPAEVEEAPAEPEKKPAKKSSLKKSDKDSKKKTEVETLPAASNVGIDHLPSAKMFPAEIDHPELGKIVACTGAYTTYADILKALEEEKTLYFACYWTKRHIREYQYAAAKMIDPKVVKNGFPLDLDILMAVLPCETMERVFAMSRITEALFQFEGEDFKYIEDTDPRSGDKFQIRVSAGMEFEIYRPADEEIVSQ